MRLRIAFVLILTLCSLSLPVIRAASTPPATAHRKATATPGGSVGSSTVALTDGDGGKIIFQRGFDAAAHLILLDPATGVETPLGQGSAPAYASSLGLIAFERDGEIMLMNEDGSNQRSLPTRAFGQHPTWSPRGSEIAFVKVGPSNLLGDIYKMGADGNNQTQLTNSGSDHSPAWGAAHQIAYVRHAGQADIFVMNEDGSSQTNITNSPADDYGPDWSLDGAKIIFTSTRHSDRGELYTMDAAGGNVARLTNDSFGDEEPAFTSSGAVVWSSGSRPGVGNNKIFMMDAAGGNARQLSSGADFDTAPAWISAAPPCAVSFSDLPPSHPFYGYVRCLACRGMVSGYGDGTFRSENNITRAQAAKLTVLAAGYSDAVTGQTFADVTPDNPFYVYIERAALHGLLSGFNCGGTDSQTGQPEPCDAQNRPYVRPNDNLTRGQLAKLVALAAGFNEAVTTQTFSDVPPSNPFYEYVERLALHGIASGYACGGPGEPCDAQSRPYFRWANNVTRGQAAKSVSLAFFPNCPEATDSAGPAITSVTRQGKNLLIQGRNFTADSVILVNGERRKTLHDDQNPTTLLIGKKMAKNAFDGDKIKVRNPDGAESPEWTYKP